MTLKQKIKWLKKRMIKLNYGYSIYGYIDDFNLRNKSINRLKIYWIKRIHEQI